MPAIIAANWKMNLTRHNAHCLIQAIHKDTTNTLIICPPHCYLHDIHQASSETTIVCAQTISEHASGAYTGEISVEMIKSCGATHALIGHSERRLLYQENNDTISKKLALCFEHGITPILCVGEQLSDRNANQTMSIIEDQLATIQPYSMPYLIAYEPVWAIGTGKTATPDMAQSVHAHIRPLIQPNTPILYGGSVNAKTIESLLAMPDIDGALVGGASLRADEFNTILAVAASATSTVSP